MRLTPVRIVALALTLVLVAACGSGDEVVTSDDPRPSTPPAEPAPAGQRYTATGTVLESPDHGPQLCAGTLSIDEVTGRIDVGVYADDGLQARFDERYGEVVLVGAMLRPVAG